MVDVVESNSVLAKSKAFDLDGSEMIWKLKLYFDSTIGELVAETPAGVTSFVDRSLLDWLFLLALDAETHDNSLELSSIACGLGLQSPGLAAW